MRGVEQNSWCLADRGGGVDGFARDGLASAHKLQSRDFCCQADVPSRHSSRHGAYCAVVGGEVCEVGWNDKILHHEHARLQREVALDEVAGGLRAVLSACKLVVVCGPSELCDVYDQVLELRVEVVKRRSSEPPTLCEIVSELAILGTLRVTDPQDSLDDVASCLRLAEREHESVGLACQEKLHGQH